MPLFNISVEKQQQAASAGSLSYPQTNQLPKDGKFFDDFNRESLNPTDAYALYTSAGTGTEVISIVNSTLLSMTTGASIGDDVDIRTTGMSFQRGSLVESSKSQLTLEVWFILAGAVTNREVFLGLLLDSGAAITAIPTTARHLGIYLDASVANTFKLTSSNGTTQSTTTSIVAVADTVYKLKITWTGLDSATIELYSGTNLTTLETTHTVTAFDVTGTGRAYNLHFFIEAESTNSPVMRIDGWKVGTS